MFFSEEVGAGRYINAKFAEFITTSEFHCLRINRVRWKCSSSNFIARNSLIRITVIVYGMFSRERFEEDIMFEKIGKYSSNHGN